MLCLRLILFLWNDLQESRTPLDAVEVNSIWEDTKNMGVLYGKGGFYGNVSHVIV